MSEFDDIVKSLQRKKNPDASFFIPGASEHLAKRPDVISTGSLNLDRALGIGGIPRGAITEIFGQPGSAKTTLALHIAREAQRQGLGVAFIDFEHALDLDYAEAIGVNKNSGLAVAQPTTANEGFGNIKWALNTLPSLGLIIVDSVAAMSTAQEVGGEIGDAQVGTTARIVNQANRILVPLLAQKNVALIYINQLRANIGVMYGATETTTGGKSIPYAAKVRMKLSASKWDKAGHVIGLEIRADIVKNKHAAPYKRAEFKLVFGKGFDRAFEIVTTAEELGLIVKKGSWYVNPTTGETLGQGYEKVYESHFEFLENAVKEKLEEN